MKEMKHKNWVVEHIYDYLGSITHAEPRTKRMDWKILYGSKSWPLQKKHQGKLTAAKMKHQLSIAGKTKLNRIRNIEIRELQENRIRKEVEKKGVWTNA